jgi:hypothetical protein
MDEMERAIAPGVDWRTHINSCVLHPDRAIAASGGGNLQQSVA